MTAILYDTANQAPDTTKENIHHHEWCIVEADIVEIVNDECWDLYVEDGGTYG